MDFHISAQQREMVASVRELAQSEFKASAQRWMDGTFPLGEHASKLAALGVLGMSVPEEYVAASACQILDTALILEEISKVCYVTAMATLGEAGVQTRVIARYAPPAIRDRILPRVVSGDCMLAICMTEPHAGNRRRELPHQRAHRWRPGDPEGDEATDQPRTPRPACSSCSTRVDGRQGREGIGCVLLEPGHHGFRGARHVPHLGRREHARVPVQRL